MKSDSFHVMRYRADSIARPGVTRCKNVFAVMVTESEKSNQFVLVVFSKSVVLQTIVPFNKSEVIAL